MTVPAQTYPQFAVQLADAGWSDHALATTAGVAHVVAAVVCLAAALTRLGCPRTPPPSSDAPRAPAAIAPVAKEQLSQLTGGASERRDAATSRKNHGSALKKCPGHIASGPSGSDK